MPALMPWNSEPNDVDARTSLMARRLAVEVDGLGSLREQQPRTPGRRSSDRREAPSRGLSAGTSSAGLLTGRCRCGGLPLAVRLRMRSGQRPQFDGTWHCSGRCLEAAVRATVRREFRAGASVESRVRHRIPLGLILQSRGVLTAEELRRALLLQEEAGAKLGDVLVQHFRVDERRIAAALAAQWNAPSWHLPANASEELLRLAPLPLFRASGSLPLRLVGTRLSLASADGVDPPIALALERMHGVTVESGIALTSAMETFWSGLEAIPQRKAEEIACSDADEIARRMTRTIEQTQPVESRSVRVGRRMWLRLWLEPASLSGGPCQRDDIMDYLFRLPSATVAQV